MKEDFDILNSIKKEKSDGFKVPENYFESFEDKMMQQVKAEEKPVIRKLYYALKPYASLAAIFIVAILIFNNIPRNIFNKQKQLAQADINTELSLDFLASSLDESDIINFIVEDESDMLIDDLNTNPQLLEGLTVEDIEDLVIF